MKRIRGSFKASNYIVIVRITFRMDNQVVWVWARKRPNIECRKSNFELRTAEQTGATRYAHSGRDAESDISLPAGCSGEQE